MLASPEDTYQKNCTYNNTLFITFCNTLLFLKDKGNNRMTPMLLNEERKALNPFLRACLIIQYPASFVKARPLRGALGSLDECDGIL